MRNASTPHVLPLLFGAVLLLYACHKDPLTPCCTTRPLNYQWLLTAVQLTTDIVMQGDPAQRHVFEYNAFNKPSVHLQTESLSSPYQSIGRSDTFYYDNLQRLIAIKNVGYGSNSRYSHRKTIAYGAGNRPDYTLKYRLDENQEYRLSDSTAYVYQGATTLKITYHIWSPDMPDAPPSMDTATFTYDANGNLTMARWKEQQYQTHVFSEYDDKINPYLLTGLDALQLEPYYAGEWEFDFRLAAYSPVLSQNNIGLRDQDYDYQPRYASADSLVAFLTCYNPAISDTASFSSQFQYNPVK